MNDSVRHPGSENSLSVFDDETPSPRRDTWSPALEWEYAKPRLRGIREMLSSSDLDDRSDVELIEREYARWSAFDEYLLLHGENNLTGEELTIGSLCSKRGNVVHGKRLDRKLGFLKSKKMQELRFFSIDDFRPDRVVKTKVLWITWTFDPSRCSRRKAWETIVHDIGVVQKRLEHEYGKVDYIRFPQAFPSSDGSAWAYCHIHGILWFHDREFTVFPHWKTNDEGVEELSYRIQEMSDLKEVMGWDALTEVKALQSMSAAGSYCMKYCRNAVSGENPDANITNAMLWFFKKHTYSMSHTFRAALLESIRQSKFSHGQVDLFGKEVGWVWHCYGVWTAAELGHPSHPDDPKDPPWLISVEPDVFKRCKKDFERRGFG